MSLAKTLRYAEWTRPFWRIASLPFALVLAMWFRLVERTSRITIEGPGANLGGPAIYVNWHRHLPLTIVLNGHSHRHMMMLDAPYMTPIGMWCSWMGLRIVPGATGSGGRVALAKLAELIAQGESVVLAVDGPAGPAFQVKPGCVELAQAAGVPIVAISYRSRRQIEFGWRWDRLLIVTPFDDIVVTFGEPIRVEKNESADDALKRVTASITR